MRRIQIVDLDGCISDDRRRRLRINPDLARTREGDRLQERSHMWDAYHRDCFLDPVCNLQEITEPEIVVLTGRTVNHHDATVMWLREVAYLSPAHILMRNVHDHRPSVVLKQEMVKELLNWNSYGINLCDLRRAIDDRSDIVKMYSEVYGIQSKVVRIGEEEHEHA